MFLNNKILKLLHSSTLSFAVNKSSGAVSVKTKLDFETNPVSNIIVLAHDSAPVLAQRNKGETAIEITLTDVNDNAPRFTNMPNQVSIQENRVDLKLFTLNVSSVIVCKIYSDSIPNKKNSKNIAIS